MISDYVAKYTHNNMCTHEQCKSTKYNQVILVHVDVVGLHTPETCDDSVFKIG